MLLVIALAGAVVNHFGSWAASAYDLMYANGVNPKALCFFFAH